MGVAGTFLLGLVLGAAPARSQDLRPYLTGATLYLSVDDWADIWLNGIPIVDSQKRTGEAAGFQTIRCVPEHLCYFQRDNVLAFSNSNAFREPQPAGDRVGLAYSLHLDLSDGTHLVFSSNEVLAHRAVYLPDREMEEPKGWHGVLFDDSSWRQAGTEGFRVPGIAALVDPGSGVSVAFLDTRVGEAPLPGEKHLYRRRFPLDISPNPRCDGQRRMEGYSGPRTVLVKKEKAPVRAPVSTPTAVPATPPSGDIYGPLREFLVEATFTPGPRPGTESPSGAQTIVFDRPPANIYLNFADGPGTYQVGLYDPHGVFLRSLFDAKVLAQRETWVDWDGNDGQGRPAPPGDYWVVLFKDRVPLQRLLLRKRSAP